MPVGKRDSGGAGQTVESGVMTLPEVAKYLHCHYSTVYRLLNKGKIPTFRVGSDWRFLRSKIDAWIEHQHELAHVHKTAAVKAGRMKGR